MRIACRGRSASPILTVYGQEEEEGCVGELRRQQATDVRRSEEGGVQSSTEEQGEKSGKEDAIEGRAQEGGTEACRCEEDSDAEGCDQEDCKEGHSEEGHEESGSAEGCREEDDREDQNTHAHALVPRQDASPRMEGRSRGAPGSHLRSQRGRPDPLREVPAT